MLRPILIHPNPKLKKVCEPVLEIDDALIELSADMLETMYHAPGIGLAAPQIGVLNRILVMKLILFFSFFFKLLFLPDGFVYLNDIDDSIIVEFSHS